MGSERLLEVFERANPDLVKEKTMDLYVASIGEEADIFATKLATELRNEGIQVKKDICSRSLNAQFKYANKIGAKFLLVLGETEISSNKAKLKDMISGEEKEVSLNIEEIYEIIK